MKFAATTVFSALGFAALASAQIPAGAPACVTSCFTIKIQEAGSLAPGVSPTNIAGLCAVHNFVQAFVNCLVDNCAASDVATGVALGQQVCASSGAAIITSGITGAGGSALATLSSVSIASTSAGAGTTTSATSGTTNSTTTAAAGGSTTTSGASSTTTTTTSGSASSTTTSGSASSATTTTASSAAGAGSSSSSSGGGIVASLTSAAGSAAGSATAAAKSPASTLQMGGLTAFFAVLVAAVSVAAF